MKNALLQLADKLLCGLMGDRLQKEGGATPGPLSRCHTLPSITHAAALGTTGKISMNFRHSPRINMDQSRPFIQISPKQGSVIFNSSNLQHITTSTTNDSPEKSEVNLPIDSDIIGEQESCYLQPPRFINRSNNNNTPDDELLYLEDPSILQSSTESINCVGQQTNSGMPTRIQRIEIHVVNSVGGSEGLGDEGCESGGESCDDVPGKLWESNRSQLQEMSLDVETELEGNNELNSINRQASDIQ